VPSPGRSGDGDCGRVTAPAKDLAPVTHPSRPHTDPRSYKVDVRFFKRLYWLARPYFARKGSWGAWLLLIIPLVMSVTTSGLFGYFTYLVRDETNALVARNQAAYWELLALVSLVTVARSATGMLRGYLGGLLHQHWRQWLTTELVDRYLERRTYYEIANEPFIDNPDQRIADEVQPFCSTAALVPSKVISTFSDFTVQAAILFSISRSLCVTVLGYAVIKAGAMLWLYKPTIKQNFDITVAEADLRYGILRVRDNAESVAFYRGEYAERAQILARLRTLLHRRLNYLNYSTFVDFAQDLLGLGWTLLLAVFLSPMFFAGEIEFGVIAQATTCAGVLLSAFVTFLEFVPSMSSSVPHIVRLAEIQEKFEELGRGRESVAGAPRIKFTVGEGIELEGVSVQTPGGEQDLVRDISLKLRPRQHLVIVGRTGVGKSSLLRAMAGLWTRGEGQITMPSPDESLFLPQRPYMILANLRDQLQYPRRRDDLSDADLQAILERVRLGDLAERHGGFDAENDWARVLSLGAQQRIGFARALVAQPRFIFLDEATSAVDVETERLLYGLLARSNATFVSVGHRPSMLDYHVTALRLLPHGKWEVMPARRVPADEPHIRMGETAGLDVA
jgi:vitamin B12/bleomycin/antimicrobial peptide transport system ATP-binding/permease protein